MHEQGQTHHPHESANFGNVARRLQVTNCGRGGGPIVGDDVIEVDGRRDDEEEDVVQERQDAVAPNHREPSDVDEKHWEQANAHQGRGGGVRERPRAAAETRQAFALVARQVRDRLDDGLEVCCHQHVVGRSRASDNGNGCDVGHLLRPRAQVHLAKVPEVLEVAARVGGTPVQDQPRSVERDDAKTDHNDRGCDESGAVEAPWQAHQRRAHHGVHNGEDETEGSLSSLRVAFAKAEWQPDKEGRRQNVCWWVEKVQQPRSPVNVGRACELGRR
mmetsp:Transcript_24015/g.66789  ORF Transcript_24015/g.66789 Transcript_24015/m.66789 type:complete len:274 (+) Transcript_24015:687-1508(+)